MYTTELFDISRTIAGRYLMQYAYPWEILSDWSAHLRKIGERLPSDRFECRGDDVWIATSATVAESAVIIGPCVIDENAEIRTFTEEESAEIARLRDTKYGTWEWNFAKSPPFTRVCTGNCGTFYVVVKSGIITSVLDNDELANKLTGIRMTPEDVYSVTDSETVNLLFR